MCRYGEEFAPLVDLKRSKGWGFINEGGAKKPKWGFISTTPGARSPCVRGVALWADDADDLGCSSAVGLL